MLEVQVSRIVMFNKDLIVLLKGETDDRVLPIHVDIGQAHSIQLKLEGLTFQRPLTHDLMNNILAEIGCRVTRAEISDLVEGTFFAKLVLDNNGKELTIDARPSDAIALALRCEAPILVAEEVMNSAGMIIPGETTDENRKPSPEQLLSQKLTKAIKDERYEEAALIRDQINHLKEHKKRN